MIRPVTGCLVSAPEPTVCSVCVCVWARPRWYEVCPTDWLTETLSGLRKQLRKLCLAFGSSSGSSSAVAGVCVGPEVGRASVKTRRWAVAAGAKCRLSPHRCDLSPPASLSSILAATPLPPPSVQGSGSGHGVGVDARAADGGAKGVHAAAAARRGRRRQAARRARRGRARQAVACAGCLLDPHSRPRVRVVRVDVRRALVGHRREVTRQVGAGERAPRRIDDGAAVRRSVLADGRCRAASAQPAHGEEACLPGHDELEYADMVEADKLHSSHHPAGHSSALEGRLAPGGRSAARTTQEFFFYGSISFA